MSKIYVNLIYLYKNNRKMKDKLREKVKEVY